MSEIAIVDSGFIYALLDDTDRYHGRVWALLNEPRWRFRVPEVVFVEVFHARIRRTVSVHHSEAFIIRAFADALPWLIEDTPLRLERMIPEDYRRISELLKQYADSGIDYVDAVVVAMAERLGTPYVMTIDEADFRRYVPDLNPPHFVLPIFDL